jgi:hypothetical protein
MTVKVVVSASRRYDGVAMSLHWLSAVVVLSLIVTGLIMTRLQAASADQFALYQLHNAHSGDLDQPFHCDPIRLSRRC